MVRIQCFHLLLLLKEVVVVEKHQVAVLVETGLTGLAGDAGFRVAEVLERRVKEMTEVSEQALQISMPVAGVVLVEREGQELAQAQAAVV